LHGGSRHNDNRMKNPFPNPDPKTLAEKLAAPGSKCPVPATHDRLDEVHHWWHEMAHWYHEPEPFRYRVGAFIQAARSVTLMLQSEKAVFTDFDWYEEWANSAKADPVLKWLNSTRIDIVHRQALEPNSWLEMKCIANPRLRKRKYLWDDDEDLPHPLRMVVSPFKCTHYYLKGPPTDHGHDWTRHWSMNGLDGKELLEFCADVYDRLDPIVSEAHERAGGGMSSLARPGSRRRLPCMEEKEIKKYRVAKTRIRRGEEVWINEPKVDHHR